MKRLMSIFVLTWIVNAAVILSVSKTPYELFVCSADFTPDVGTDNVSLISVTAKNQATGADATSLIVAASPAPGFVGSTKVVAFAAQGGISGQSYVVSIKVLDSTTGEKFEGQIILIVKDVP